MTIQLLQALTEGNDSIVVATAADLKEFALTILSEAKKQNEVSFPSSRYKNQEQKEDTKEDEHFLSSEEVRKVLGISKTTLWRYQRSGLLSPSRIGKGKKSRLRFEQSAVLRLINKNGPSIRQ